MDCEMCGREEAVGRASVEGTILALGANCSRYGTVVSKIAPPVAPRKEAAKQSQGAQHTQPAAAEEIEAVVSNFGELIKQKREQLGKGQEDGYMKLEDFAKLISVKESVLHKMETGHFVPNVEEAKRIGKALGLKLVERVEDIESIVPPAKKDELTLGDLIKIKKKK